MAKRDYDSTVARIAGNIVGTLGVPIVEAADLRKDFAIRAVAMARAIVAEVKRTEPNAAE